MLLPKAESFTPGTSASRRSPHQSALTSKPWLTAHSISARHINQENDISGVEETDPHRAQSFSLSHITRIRRNSLIWFLFADAAQQTCDGACWWRLGDLRELPAQTRPMPRAPVLQGGRQVFSYQQQVSKYQRPEPWQLPGGGSTLPQQKMRRRSLVQRF